MGIADDFFGSQAPTSAPTGEDGTTNISTSIFGGMPSYLQGAAMHDVANEDTSVLDSVKKLSVASIYSGANSFYNTGVAVANWFGADAEKADTYQWLQEYDDDTAKYYQDHKAAADLAGFVAGSFIPGMIATKIYNYGMGALKMAETGIVGANMSEATGLLIPTMNKYLKLAKADLISPTSPGKWINGNFQKAILAGVGEQAIQGAIQTTAVFATMGASPILSDMDASDIGWNILLGGAFQGVLGGGLETAKLAGSANRFISKVDKELVPFGHITGVAEGTSNADSAINGLYTRNQILAKLPDSLEVEGVDILPAASTKRDQTLAALHDAIRTDIRTMAAKGDDVLGNLVTDNTLLNQDFKSVAGNLQGLQSFTRVSQKTPVEVAVDAAIRRIGNGVEKPEDLDLFRKTQVRYLQNHGEGAGSIFDDAPVHWNLADTLKPGEEIKVTAEGVKAGSRNFVRFTVDPKKPWSSMEASVEEAEMRHMWANELPPLPSGFTVNADDIPLLGKAVRENTPGLTIRLPNGGGDIAADSINDLGRFYKEHVDSVVGRMKAASDAGMIVSDPDVLERKLKELLTIPFTRNDSLDMSTWGQQFRHSSNTTGNMEINVRALAKMPFSEAVKTVKHEEGHQIFNVLEHLGLTSHAKLADDIHLEAMKVSKLMRPASWASAKSKDFMDYLSSPTELMADTFSYFSLHPEQMKTLAPNFEKTFGKNVRPVSRDIVNSLALKARVLDNVQIAKALNVKLGYLEKTAVDNVNPTNDLFAIQSAAREHTQRMVQGGLWNEANGIIPVYKQPQFTKLVYDATPQFGLDGNVLDGIAAVKERQRLFQNAADTIVGNFTRELDAFLPEPTELDTRTATRQPATQGKTTAANGGYGSIGSLFQRIGAGIQRLMTRERNTTHEVLDSALYKLRMDPAAAAEYSALETMARSTPEPYYLSEDGTALVLRRSVLKAQAEAAGTKYEGTVINPAAKETIPINSQAAQEVIAAHISRNADRLGHDKALKSLAGHMDNKDPRAFYPPPVNPNKYPHIAFVVDDSVTGSGHVSMIYGASPEHLDGLVSQVKRSNPEFKVITKSESERYHKALGDFKRDETLSENYINTALFRSGVSSNFIPKTDPSAVAQHLLDWHLEKDAQISRMAVTTKYFKEFQELSHQGDQFTNLATSKVSRLSFAKNVESAVKNPYNDLIKTALNITSTNEMPIWTAVNNYADTIFSKLYSGVTGTLFSKDATRTPADLDAVNKIFQEKGVKTAYYDAAGLAWANHTAPKGDLNTFVSRSNGILASLLLRLDPMNAVNNTVGSTILTHTELNSVLKNIKAANPDIVGKLAYIKVPGTEDEIFSAIKLHANAIKMFASPELRVWSRENGFSARHVEQFHSILDDLALTGTESVSQLNSKMTSAYNKFMAMAEVGERITGNKFAEEFNRATSAFMMKQLTDVGVSQGLFTEKTALAYINTFVNRTQGNYIASQRPLMFQGALGQAMGLFQTYQLNFAQQLLRHVAEGDMKTSALALGLQGTIYGANGLPGFQAINTHLIGTLPGNTKHKDMYDATYGVAGKEAGDWLTYGLPSNVLGLLHPDLKFNLYTRGDINPRNPTVIPLNPADAPIISASVKFFGAMKESFQKMQQGGNVWPSFLQGLEHSGINRPLAGLAQTLEAAGNPNLQSYSTTGSGNLIASNDLLSLANAMRITGARPLHEALTSDAAARFATYDAADSAKRKILGEAIKSTVMLGAAPTAEQMDKFAGEYVKAGGSQQGFNKFYVGIFKQANTAQANKITENLKNPHSESMQRLLGGARFNDSRNLNNSDDTGE